MKSVCTLLCLLPVALKAQGLLTGRLQDQQLAEVSGIAASRIHKGIFYVHNDSGDTSRFFAITADGALKGVFYFEGDARAPKGVVDCEDIAVGPGPQQGISYIYAGDIGDNFGFRNSIQVYRIPEPASLPGKNINVKSKRTELHYPDGPHDAEALMIDPQDSLLYIITKREDSVLVYTTPLLFPDKGIVTLQPAGKLFFRGRGHGKWIVGGSISPDGQQVVLKSNDYIYYWKRNSGEHLHETMSHEPRILPYRSMGQEEAICISDDGRGYYVTGEGVHAGIYYYHLPK